MKKFFFLVGFVMISLFVSHTAFAQDATPSANSQSDYLLPYPGLLPDSLLYPLKLVRDRIVGFLISDPLKKSEFNLLQADKRLSSGISLFEKRKDKEELVYSTISKGENYFEEAIVKLDEAKKQGSPNTSDISTKLSQSAKKHAEVLKDLKKKVKNKQGFENLEKRVEGFEKRLVKYSQN
ncbi:MAG: DUF5667 domain-containing protein [Candidatus Levybacteria bacterium]|nr:DUF5667 domain-containing protein [Candidatus Levybacteria bacterium]